MINTKTIEQLNKAYEDSEKAYERYKKKVLETKGYDVKCGFKGPESSVVYPTEEERIEALREE